MRLNCGVGEDSWEFLGQQGDQPVHPKRDQSWVFIFRTDVEAETPILWLPDAKSWLIGKDPDAGKDWRQEEKGTTEDEMVGWHHRLNGHEFRQTLGVGDGQGGLVCWSLWGRKESDTAEWLDWTELNWGKLKTLLNTWLQLTSQLKTPTANVEPQHCALWLQPLHTYVSTCLAWASWFTLEVTVFPVQYQVGSSSLDSSAFTVDFWEWV